MNGGPVLPVFHVNTCVKDNHTFCWSWFSSNWSSVLWPALRQHVVLVVIAVGIGFIISAALALAAHRHGWVERPVLTVSAVLYTIPSIALFEILASIRGLALTLTSVEIALVSYTIFILFRNMLTGLRGVPAEVRDAATGMGMTANQVLWRIEVPMALPAIIAGLRIATVTVISLGTIAAYVDQEGLGQPIFLAIHNNLFKTELLSAGAMAVLLALVADGALVLLQRLITPWARRSA